MNPGKTLLLLAVFLFVIAASLGVFLLIQRVPDGDAWELRFDRASAAVEEGRETAARWELLMASMKAVSEHQWRRMLTLAAMLIPEAPSPSDYRFFRFMAGRALRAHPSQEDFLAAELWALARSGQYKRAAKSIDDLDSPLWDELAAEIRLLDEFTEKGEEPLARLERLLTETQDPEFFRKMSAALGSAELLFDAALLFMKSGRPSPALSAAKTLAEGTLRWSDPSLPDRVAVYGALGRMAQDAGDRDAAISWLGMRLEETVRRRSDTWRDHQLLGDLYWSRYLLAGNAADLDAAALSWERTLDILSQGDDSMTALSDGSWRLLLNMAALEEERGRRRKAGDYLDIALMRFPEEQEVVAAWALGHADDEPMLSRRLLRNSSHSHPSTALASLRVDPGLGSPGRYEARLWELFEAITEGEYREVSLPTARGVTLFLLHYLVGRRDLPSIELVVERYLRSRSGEVWILSWRLAADALEGHAYLNLIPSRPGDSSDYEEYASWAAKEGNWKTRYDLALAALAAADEIDEGIFRISETGRFGSAENYELAGLLHFAGLDSPRTGPLADRVNSLLEARDTKKFPSFPSAGRKGRDVKRRVGAALALRAEILRREARDALEFAVEMEAADSRSGGMMEKRSKDRAKLHYFHALSLWELGETAAAGNAAAAALEADPSFSRARLFLSSGGA